MLIVPFLFEVRPIQITSAGRVAVLWPLAFLPYLGLRCGVVYMVNIESPEDSFSSWVRIFLRVPVYQASYQLILTEQITK